MATTQENIRLRIVELAVCLLTNPDVELEEDETLSSIVESVERYVFADPIEDTDE